MAGTLQAKRFAQAIFEIARERDTLDKWSEDLHKVANLAKESDVVSTLDNPRFSLEDKSRFISTQLQSVDPLTLNLVKLLISRGDFSLSVDISSEYYALLDSYRGIEKAEVTTAVPLDEREKNRLIQQLETLTGKKINLASNVDSGILGGIVIRVGGKLIDGSTVNQLSALRSEMISSGR